ncbi:MAG: DnaJ domain-containing protein [Pseudomonadota bacterium]
MMIPLAGSVATQPLAEVFAALRASSFTGVLALVQDAHCFSVSFARGLVVDAENPVPQDQLGRLLVDSGLATPAQIAESVRILAANPGQRQLDVLLEMGVIKPDKAAYLAAMSLARRTIRVFGLRSATYRIEAKSGVTSDAGPIDARWLVYHGIRQLYDERRLIDELRLLDGKAFSVRTGEKTVDSNAFGFRDDENVCLGNLERGFFTLVDFVDSCAGQPRLTVLAVVRALLATQSLEVRPAGAVRLLRRQSLDQTEPVQALAGICDELAEMSAPQASAPQVPPQQIQATPVQVTAAPAPATQTPATQTPTQQMPSLQQTPPCSVGQAQRPPIDGAPIQGSFIRRAPVATESPFAATPPSGTVAPPPSDTAGKKSSIPRSRRTPPRGIRAPSGKQLRPGGGKATAAPAGEESTDLKEEIRIKLEQVKARADHFAFLGLDRKAGAPQVKAAYFQLAKLYHPDRLALLKLEEMRPQVERIFAALSEAFSVLSDDRKRKEYLAVLDRGGEAASKQQNDEQATKAAKLIAAEEHFRKGEMALRRQHFPLAVEEFKQAFVLNPDEAEHHAYYAWALYCAAPDKKRAIPEVRKLLQKAVSLDEKCAKGHFYLGCIYNQNDEPDRAYSCFQKALHINPGDVDSAREIRVMDMRRQKTEKKGSILDRLRKK